MRLVRPMGRYPSRRMGLHRCRILDPRPEELQNCQTNRLNLAAVGVYPTTPTLDRRLITTHRFKPLLKRAPADTLPQSSPLLRDDPALEERQPEDRLRDAWARLREHHPGHLLSPFA